MNMLRNLLLAAALLCGSVLTGCSDSISNVETEADTSAVHAVAANKPVIVSFTDTRVTGLAGVAENDRLRLFLEEKTGVVAVLDKKSGEVWYSNSPERDTDTLAAGVNKDLLSAQLSIDFYNNFGQINTVNSYTDSVAHNQMTVENIPRGIKVTYQFGKEEQGIDDLPLKLSKARYEELTGKLDKAGKRNMMIAYTEDAEKSIYIRNDTMQGLQLQRALDTFSELGYTPEDLEKDLKEFNLQQNRSEPRVFLASIEYTLDGDSLVVKVPATDIHYPEEYPIHKISLLSYFGAQGKDAKGSMLVPDGSGALIHFNNGKTQYPSYEQLVYGIDKTTDTLKTGTEEKVRLPVFGMMRKDGAFLGIIEEGGPIASIRADVSGRLNSYNFIYSSITLINKGEVSLSASGQERSLPRFQEHPPKTDYTVRYAFLNGEDASYPGMAGYYQQYLLKQGGLPELKPGSSSDASVNVPFYLNLVGSITKEKHFLGIPYSTLEPLTTLEQAKLVVEGSQERNIRNIRLQYSGWFNNGIDHEVPDRVSVDGAIGGSKALQNFIDFTRDKEVAFFPDAAIAEAHSSSGFNLSKEASRTLKGDPATIYPLELALNRRDINKTPSYVVSPRYITKYVNSLLDGLESYKPEGISLRDLGEQLNSDYRKGQQIDRTESQGISSQALSAISDQDLKIMADGGNAYALPYVTDITNAPMSSSGFKIEDETIPFYQMVIHGYAGYTGAPYNLSTYTDMRQYMLKCLEYGSGIYFKWMYEPSYAVKDTEHSDLYAINYKQWLDEAAQIYSEVNGVLSRVQNKRMIFHEKLAEGVYRTNYENGVFVIVNYNQTAVRADGSVVEAESYITGGA
ncbi:MULTISPECIES: DUF5696 domain-containing protein [unclassified Paenibacillus]|uniref:DUF5696 domain-containing protein n=1 Tax=unclassified Paenibacillus TaxID=185978 RepID=UPI0007E4CC68|nr:DUF5696 domain-containing protein [Paenibacillus sp. AD87]OAX48536.1 hypothetical protein gpAD87_10210 [Paenibacillus sp. AD87]